MLTAEYVRSVLNYDQASGLFTWRRRWGIREGTPAGFKSRRSSHMGGGYYLIRLNRVEYAAHRLAWLYVHGEMPQGCIDHINCNRADNRIANLRVASHSQNMANKPRSRNNTSGFKGVSFHKAAGKWIASTQKDGKYHYLGLHETAEAAHAAYVDAATRLFGEFARAA